MCKNKKYIKAPDYTEWAYLTIKEKILNNKYLAGEQIHIEEIADTLQISRTPVRESLLRLQANGLVTVCPHVGYFVKGITKSELHEVFELRFIIECYAAERAAATMNEAARVQLRHFYEICNTSVEEKKYPEFTENETLFHNSLIEHLQNDHVLTVMDAVSDLIYRAKILAQSSEENIRLSNQEHYAVLNAIEQHNSYGAAAAMRIHIQNVEARLSDIISFDA